MAPFAPSVPGEPLSFLYALLLGIALGVLWDVFRTMRVWRGGDAGQSAWSIKLRRYRRRHSPYPIFRMKRNDAEKPHVSHHFLWTFLEDLLFMMIAGISFLLFCFDINMGIVRWYLLLGVIAGFLLYYHTIGRLVIAWSALIGAFVRATLVFFYNYTLYYVVVLLTFLVNRLLRLLRMMVHIFYDRFVFAALAAETKKRLDQAHAYRMSWNKGKKNGREKNKDKQTAPFPAP